MVTITLQSTFSWGHSVVGNQGRHKIGIGRRYYTYHISGRSSLMIRGSSGVTGLEELVTLTSELRNKTSTVIGYTIPRTRPSYGACLECMKSIVLKKEVMCLLLNAWSKETNFGQNGITIFVKRLFTWCMEVLKNTGTPSDFRGVWVIIMELWMV